MRHLPQLLIAGGLLLGTAMTADAQSNPTNAFGVYPSGILTGSPYGANWSGFYGLNPGGFPLNTYNQPYNANGANYSYMLPGTNYRNAYPYAPGTTTYGSGYVAPGTTGYGYNPGYGTNYPYSTYGYGTPYGSYRQGAGMLPGASVPGRR